MVAKAGVRIDVEAAKGKRAVRDFSKTATADLEKVRQKGQAANKALVTGQNNLAKSTGNLRGQMRPLGEGMESLNRLMGNTGTETGAMGSALLRLATGPMGLLTAAIGVGIGLLISWIGKQAKARGEAEELTKAIQAQSRAFRENALEFLPVYERLDSMLDSYQEKLKKISTDSFFLRDNQLLSFAADLSRKFPDMLRTTKGVERLFDIIKESNKIGVKGGFGGLQDALKVITERGTISSIREFGKALDGIYGKSLFDDADKLARWADKMRKALDKVMTAPGIRSKDTQRAYKQMRAELDNYITHQKNLLKLMKLETRELEDQKKLLAGLAYTRPGREPGSRVGGGRRDRYLFGDKLAPSPALGPVEHRTRVPDPERGGPSPSGGPIHFRRESSAAVDQFAQDARASVQSSLSDGIFDGITTGFKNGSDILESFANSLTRAVTDALSEGILNALGSDSGGGGSGSGIAGAVVSLFSSDGTSASGAGT